MRKALSLFLFALLISCGELLTQDTPDLVQNSRCGLFPDPGPCKAYLPKYYYDKPAAQCREFIWGGCGGMVPFESLEKCKKCSCRNSNE